MGAVVGAAACEGLCSLFSLVSCQAGHISPTPVGIIESTVPERLDLGHAAPGPGRARHSAPRRETRVVVGEAFSPQGQWPQLLTGSV